MADDATRTLFHPFETGLLPMPAAGARVLVVGPGPDFGAPQGFDADLVLVQGFRPHFNALAARGFAVLPDLDPRDRFDAALVLLGRHRGENDDRLFRAARAVRPGGLVVVAGAKTSGADALRRRLAASFPGLGHAAKHHGLALWFDRPDDRAVDTLLTPPPDETVVDGRFRARPGMFSHDRVDAGSRILAAHLPSGLSGRVADFGAGWGWLAVAVAEQCPGVCHVDLYEADHAALAAARDNWTRIAPAQEAGFHWADLVHEGPSRRHDAIVMNPPFHEGRAADPELGRAMIAAAARALKPGGRLFLVANRGLPYEKTLAGLFRQSGETARDSTYKVLWARL